MKLSNPNSSIFSKLKYKYLKRKCINQNKKLRTRYAVGYYTLEELETSQTIGIFDNITKREINNLIFVNKECTIIFDVFSTPYDEKKFIENLVNIFKILEKHHRSYNIKIHVKNRELLNQSNLFKYCKNINLTINSYSDDYTKEEYFKEEIRLDELVKTIKESNLSPYEKFIAVYNKVKQIKQYNDNKDKPEASRSLKYILDNEYIVCTGYANLLTVLLDKIGIPSIKAETFVDTSYDEGFSMECIPTKLVGHERIIVKIDDDKYNIHGIYLADPTWDNNMNHDLYKNCAITFDRKKEAYRLEELTPKDLLLDFHNFEEFIEKINFYLKREIKNSIKRYYPDVVCFEYEMLYNKIMKILMVLDYSKYKELYNKYNKVIKEKCREFRNSDNIPLKEIEEIFSDFLTEYGMYIIPLSNQKIDESIQLEASSNVKKVINDYNETKLEEWINETKRISDLLDETDFPYVYNPNEPRINYLETHSKARIRIKNKKTTI